MLIKAMGLYTTDFVMNGIFTYMVLKISRGLVEVWLLSRGIYCGFCVVSATFQSWHHSSNVPRVFDAGSVLLVLVTGIVP